MHTCICERVSDLRLVGILSRLAFSGSLLLGNVLLLSTQLQTVRAVCHNRMSFLLQAMHLAHMNL